MKSNSFLKATMLSVAAIVMIFCSCATQNKTTQTSAPVITKRDTSQNNSHVRGSHPVSKNMLIVGINDSNKVITEIEQDDAGMYFITGYISRNFIEGKDTLNNFGGNDILIARYDEDANLIWMKNAGGWLDEAGTSITVDTHGNMYITGYFYGEIKFGNITIDSHGGEDMFIAKYDPFGNCLWAKSIGGEGDDTGLSISVDLNLSGTDGSIHVIGSFGDGKAMFGSKEITSPNDEQYFRADFTTTDGDFKSIFFIQH